MHLLRTSDIIVTRKALGGIHKDIAIGKGKLKKYTWRAGIVPELNKIGKT